MSTHNICFRQEIRKILCGYPLLSVAMLNDSKCAVSLEHSLDIASLRDIACLL